jgi:HprK-related kinase A
LRVGELDPASLRRLLHGTGLRLRTGPVVSRIQSRIEAVVRGVGLQYAEHPIEPDDGFVDFHVVIERPGNLRRWFRPQVVFRFDGGDRFAPLPGDQGFPMLEWGLNWCVSAHCHQFVCLHAAVIEKGGRALILPAPPGSGKSTLCTGLVFSGWRLLSDELTLIAPKDGRITPLVRPFSLKNASIDVIRQFAPEAVFGPVVTETIKGSVAHCRPPADSVRRMEETATPGWVVLPRYVAGAPPRLEPLSKAMALMRLIENAFNYHVHGAQGFEVLADLIERCDCYEFSYSRLEDAVPLFDRLAATAPGQRP